MIKNILIYIAVLAISFSFAVFYYAWFSNFLLIVVLCLPVLSLLCSLPFMIYSAVKGFSLYASKVIYAGDDVVINLAANNRSGLFCPLPVAAVTGKLVTGNAAPLLQRHLLRRQQDVCRCKTGSRFHSRFLPSLLQFNFFNATATTLNCISQICCLNVALIF